MAHVKEIIDRYFLQAVSGKAKSLFAEWLSLDTDSDLKDEVLKEYWEKEYYLAPEYVEKSYRAVQKKIKAKKQKTARRYAPWYVTGVAASLALAMLLYSLLGTPVRDDVRLVADVEMTECYVGHGEKHVLTLPDSTTIILNSGSLLIYPKQF